MHELKVVCALFVLLNTSCLPAASSLQSLNCPFCETTGVRCHPWLRLLGSTGVDDGWLDVVLDLARSGTQSLELLDDLEALVISNLTEDDVLAIEPGGDNGGDEELGAVGVGASVGHGQDTRLGVGSLEVLIRKLLAVDRLATRAITTSEVATLKHELRNDSMERGALVPEALLAGAESTEVLSSLRDYIVVEDEVDPSGMRRRRSLAVAFGISTLLVKGRVGPFDIEVCCHSHFGGR